MVNLYAEARRTQNSQDEAIVAKLEAIAENLKRTESEIADLRRQIVELSRRRSEMQEVRGQFRNSGYDHPQIGFGNDSDIGNGLKNVLEGVVRSGVLWDKISGSAHGGTGSLQLFSGNSGFAGYAAQTTSNSVAASTTLSVSGWIKTSGTTRDRAGNHPGVVSR